MAESYAAVRFTQFQRMIFLHTNVLQGSVATCFTIDEIFNYRFTSNFYAKSVCERVLEINQHLTKL